MKIILKGSPKLLTDKMRNISLIGNISKYSAVIPGPKYYPILGSMMNAMITIGSAEKWDDFFYLWRIQNWSHTSQQGVNVLDDDGDRWRRQITSNNASQFDKLNFNIYVTSTILDSSRPKTLSCLSFTCYLYILKRDWASWKRRRRKTQFNLRDVKFTINQHQVIFFYFSVWDKISSSLIPLLICLCCNDDICQSIIALSKNFWALSSQDKV